MKHRLSNKVTNLLGLHVVYVWNHLFFISVLDECGVADWNVCDKTFANCKEKYAAYSCHCFPGYMDFSGTGETCMGKGLFLPS